MILWKMDLNPMDSGWVSGRGGGAKEASSSGVSGGNNWGASEVGDKRGRG